MRVLKGHLVVERNFELFFEDVLPDYSKLEFARLTFSQKHQLYRAVHPGGEHSWFWGRYISSVSFGVSLRIRHNPKALRTKLPHSLIIFIPRIPGRSWTRPWRVGAIWAIR